MYDAAVNPQLFAASFIPNGISELLFPNVEYIVLAVNFEIILHPLKVDTPQIMQAVSSFYSNLCITSPIPNSLSEQSGHSL